MKAAPRTPPVHVMWKGKTCHMSLRNNCESSNINISRYQFKESRDISRGFMSGVTME